MALFLESRFDHLGVTNAQGHGHALVDDSGLIEQGRGSLRLQT